MGIKQIEEAVGIDHRSYARGYVFKCFGCNLWVRFLRDNELCEHCNKTRGIKKTIPVLNTQQAVEANKE